MTTSHPTYIESFGTHCQVSSCNLDDFLPFHCTYCNKWYCSAHRTPTCHSCPSYDASVQDVRATLCPLCGDPIPIVDYGGRQADLNVAMEAHLEGKGKGKGKCRMINDQNGLAREDDQQVLKLKEKEKERGQHQCRFGRCEHRNWAGIICDACGKEFCPTHREPRHHKCSHLGSSEAMSWTSPVSKVLPRSSTKGTVASAPSSMTSYPRAVHPVPPSESSSNSIDAVSNKFKLLTTRNKSQDSTTARRIAKERENAVVGLKKRAEKGCVGYVHLSVL